MKKLIGNRIFQITYLGGELHKYENIEYILNKTKDCGVSMIMI